MYRHAIDVRICPDVHSAVDRNWVRAVARRALQLQRLMEQAELSVTLTTEETLLHLNERYRGTALTTDVLSFTMDEKDSDFPTPMGVRMLGDVVISYPQAVRQAAEYGHSIQREVAFLTVHGILHLLGMDHESPEDEREMLARQEDILQSLGLPRDVPAA